MDVDTTANGSSRIAYVLRSYPRLSQTFIVNEIVALERLGLTIDVFASTKAHDPLVHESVAQVRAPVCYLDARRSGPAALADHLRVAASSPRRYVATLAYVLRRRDLDEGYVTRSRFACFDQAVRLAAILRRRGADSGRAVRRVHSHFAHDPTLIALLLKRLTAIPFSFSAHARDLYQTRTRLLAERVREASAVVTCCHANLDYLRELVPREAQRKLHLIHHGIDLEAFRPHDAVRDPARPLIVSAGRLVPKKGFADLLGACRLVKEQGRAFRLVVLGDGPLRDELVASAARLGLTAESAFPGAYAQRKLVTALREADVFALTPCVTDDGDRDGIPNALVEAMACGLPVVSTAVGGIPEVVVHDQTGLLAEPHDVGAIADHLASLLADPARRERLGRTAREAIVERFDADQNARRLAAVLEGRGGDAMVLHKPVAGTPFAEMVST